MISFAEAPIEPKLCIACTVKRVAVVTEKYREEHDLPEGSRLKMVMDEDAQTITVKCAGFAPKTYTYQELDA